MTVQAEARAHRQEAILAAALEIVAEGGIAALTIQTLRDRSGASVGSIYHHFGDRAGVVFALYQASLEHCFSALRRAMEQPGCASAEAGLKGMVLAYLEWVAAHPIQARFVYDASQGDLLRGHEDAILAFKGKFLGEVERWMGPWIAAGRVRAMPRWAYDPVLMGPAHEFARRWLSGLEVPMAEAAPVIAEAVWRSVAEG